MVSTVAAAVVTIVFEGGGGEGDERDGGNKPMEVAAVGGRDGDEDDEVVVVVTGVNVVEWQRGEEMMILGGGGWAESGQKEGEAPESLRVDVKMAWWCGDEGGSVVKVMMARWVSTAGGQSWPEAATGGRKRHRKKEQVIGKRSCDSFYWIDPKINNGWYKNQMIELYLALNPDKRYEYTE
ncbi:hypothetical protein Tco_0313627 [Tanacetum coccineum]